ncbi:MAG: biotin/lipoyl-binding protein [Acidobacteria bacterium]|nr:biotin/lipoyl-binding protein [Acidobacteriota bacterium]
MKFQARIKDEIMSVEVRRDGDHFDVLIDGESHPVALIFSDASHDVLLMDNNSFDVILLDQENHYQVNVLNRFFDVEIIDPRKKALYASAMDEGGRKAIRTQMPGRIIKILVEQGAEVAEGQGLLILEAMKMQNEIKAPRAGVVVSLAVRENDSVEGNALLAELE